MLPPARATSTTFFTNLGDFLAAACAAFSASKPKTARVRGRNLLVSRALA